MQTLFDLGYQWKYSCGSKIPDQVITINTHHDADQL